MDYPFLLFIKDLLVHTFIIKFVFVRIIQHSMQDKIVLLNTSETYAQITFEKKRFSILRLTLSS